MDIRQVMFIVSAIIILDGINLLTKTSKILVEFSMKQKAFCYSRTRGAIARNYDKTAKVLAINGITIGTLFVIFSINIKNSQESSSPILSFIIMGIIIVIKFILDVKLDDIK